eukprot:m.10307 g.10307  ORF g.10307 m.10307 type:complete len:572 (-) comp2734_c0_seq1:1552-3267(-)
MLRRRTVKKMKKKKPRLHKYQVEMAPQRYIHTPVCEITKAMIGQVETEAEKCAIIDFCERMEALYALRNAMHREALRHSFALFCPTEDRKVSETELLEHGKLHAKEESYAERGSDSTQRRIEDEEDTFLRLLHMAFTKANFELLKQGEYDSGKQESFEVGVDMAMDTSKLDTAFIERLHTHMAHDDQFKAAADVTKKVLVYHRGQGQATISGMFMMEKIDILLVEVWNLSTWCLITLVVKALTFMFDLRGHLRRVRWLVNTMVQSLLAHSDERGTGAATKESSYAPDNDDSVKRRIVYRSTLQRALRNNWLTLFAPVTLIEPTYREMVIVYRTKEVSQEAKTNGNIPHVDIKTFANVPMADFEIVLPAQRTITRATDVLKLIGVLGAAGMYIYKSVQEEYINDPNADVEDVLVNLFPVLLGAATYASKAVTQWMNAQKKYNATVTKYLYEKSFANNHTVFTYLMDSIVYQELKESLLAYFFLWQHGAQTLVDLDDVVERFMKQLNEDVDFDAVDGLNKLANDQLVRYSGPLGPHTQLFYLPITQCIHKTEEKVTQLLYNRNRPCPYCSVLD